MRTQGNTGPIWHPFTQMKTASRPIEIVSGKGAVLKDNEGKEYIDAISSWWVNIHGHSHPHIANKIYEQLNTLEHSIFAGFTHPFAIELSERLLKILPDNQKRVFFSDNGSTAVEVAIKMAIQFGYNKEDNRKKIIALQDAYHGDTFGAMSAAERSPFSAPFNDFLFEVTHIDPSDEEAMRMHCEGGDVLAFIYEPLVQGAGGMKMYSSQQLEKLLQICDEYNVIKIADEVMTGFGRTSSLFASDQIEIKPDIMCLSKGLTGGTLPMAITTCADRIYEAFLSDDLMKTFFHGHSFTGNPVGCAASLASMDILLDEGTQKGREMINSRHVEFSKRYSGHRNISNIRICGTILAMDIVTSGETNYFNEVRDKLYDHFIENGVLLRPLGNVVYVLPPYCISEEQLDKVYDTLIQGVEKLEA